MHNPYLNHTLPTIYCFTAPSETPATRNLDNEKYSITIGTAINIAPAANRENSVSPRCVRPTATVHRFLFLRSMFGRMKSLQGHANEVRAVYTRIGLESGIVTFQKIVGLDAPSILAAS